MPAPSRSLAHGWKLRARRPGSRSETKSKDCASNSSSGSLLFWPDAFQIRLFGLVLVQLPHDVLPAVRHIHEVGRHLDGRVKADGLLKLRVVGLSKPHTGLWNH